MPTTGNKVTPTEIAKAAVAATPTAMAALDSAEIRLADASLKEIGTPIINDPLAYNDFLTNIYNKFILTEVVQGRFENPLRVLKKDNLPPFGDTIERMIFNPAKALEYTPDDSNGDNILTIVNPDIKVEYVKVNREDEYRLYIPYKKSMQAFMSDNSFGQFLDAGMASLYNGDAIDEFRLMLKVVSDIYNLGLLNNMELPADAVDKTKMIINAIKLFKLPSTKYNAYSRLYPDNSLITWSNPKRICIIAKAEFMTDIQVEVLAAAFNLSKVEMDALIIEVDEFETPDIECFIGDISYFRVHDVLRRVEKFERADKMAVKSYYHVWQAINCTLFANALVLRKEGSTAPEVQTDATGTTNVTINI